MADIQTIRDDIDVDRILLEVDTFILSLDGFIDQICIQGIDAEMDPYFGSRALVELGDYDEFDFKVNLFPELDYTNSIVEELGLYRTRIMHMAPKSCLTYHKDPTFRVHVPLETNKGSFLMIDKTAHHLPNNNSAYLADTTKWHTAINASFNTRTHLVGVVDYDKYDGNKK
jgi:hypothetical protein